MNRLKEFFLKNNYHTLKIIGAVLTAGIAILVVALLTSGDEDSGISTGDMGSSAIETTVYTKENDSTKDSSADITLASDTKDTTLSLEAPAAPAILSTSEPSGTSTNQIALENDDTTTTHYNSENESKTKEQTTTKSQTAQSPDTSIQQMTSSQVQPTTTTQAQTTTQKPTTTTQAPKETTTQEETTTAPPRGANGVILEELVCNKVGGSYALPKTYDEIYEDNGTTQIISKTFSYIKVPKTLYQNVFCNEILLYSTENGTGSLENDITKIYGEPLYRYQKSDTGTVCLIYKYLESGENNAQDLYMRFEFPASKDYKLVGVTLSSLEIVIADKE